VNKRDGGLVPTPQGKDQPSRAGRQHVSPCGTSYAWLGQIPHPQHSQAQLGWLLPLMLQAELLPVLIVGSLLTEDSSGGSF
jgi:hypothetical protein